MRKTFIKSSMAIAVATVGLMGASSGALAASIDADASASVLEPIGISQTTALNFGTFAATDTAGEVVMASDGTGRSGTNVALMTDEGQAASMAVSGEPGLTYVVTLPSTAVNLTNETDSTKTMVLDTFTSVSSSGTNTLDTTAGTDTLAVGGTLNVGVNQAAGSYIGTYPVTVEYN